MFKNTFKNISFSNHQPPATDNQSGQSSIYIVIIIMVVIFAVMFVGGVESLSSGNEASPVTITPSAPASAGSASPTTSPATTTSPTTSPTTNSWSLSFDITPTCKSGKSSYKDGFVNVKGTKDGYIKLEINDNGLKTLSTQKFTSPEGKFPLALSNEYGFNDKTWKISLYSGGIQGEGGWRGGDIQTTKDGDPTGCN